MAGQRILPHKLLIMHELIIIIGESKGENLFISKKEPSQVESWNFVQNAVFVMK